MYIYKTMPAFGLETAKCNAKEHYQNMYDKVAEKTKNKAQYFSPKVAASEPATKSFPIDLSEAAKTGWKVANITKILGYIPLVGTLVGLSRIARASNASKELLPNKAYHIARGCVESLSLGFLLILPDLILTGYRLSQSKTSGSEYTPIKA